MVLKRNIFTKILCVIPLPSWHALPSLQKKRDPFAKKVMDATVH